MKNKYTKMFTYKTLKKMEQDKLTKWVKNNERVKRTHDAKQLRERGFTFGDLFRSILN